MTDQRKMEIEMVEELCEILGGVTLPSILGTLQTEQPVMDKITEALYLAHDLLHLIRPLQTRDETYDIMIRVVEENPHGVKPGQILFARLKEDGSPYKVETREHQFKLEEVDLLESPTDDPAFEMGWDHL